METIAQTERRGAEQEDSQTMTVALRGPVCEALRENVLMVDKSVLRFLLLFF